MGRLLGTHWTIKDLKELVEKTKGTSRARTDDEIIFFPLALAINPDFIESLKQVVKTGPLSATGGTTGMLKQSDLPAGTAEVEEMASWGKDKFLGFLNDAVGGISVSKLPKMTKDVDPNGNR